MVGCAIARFIRVSPRKTRAVVNLIRDKGVENAFAILENCDKKPSRYVHALLKSALDNVMKKTQNKLKSSDLYISRITVDGGPMFKRYKAASMGRAVLIRRRTSHIKVELDVKQK